MDAVAGTVTVAEKTPAPLVVTSAIGASSNRMLILALSGKPEPITVTVEPGRTVVDDSLILAVVGAGTMGCIILNTAELVFPEASVADML